MPTRSAVGVIVDGRYRIVEPLAAGGMGSVYLGEQDNLHRQVAIKLIRQPDPEDAERFQREAEALAAVSHPAIVEVYDYLHEDAGDVSYLVMAYVKGNNVADHAAAQPGGVLLPLEGVELMLPVASALVELHTHAILHRDLKPANLVRYVRADGRAAVKLVDFGIARREQDAGLTAEGLIVGTPPYLPAEVVLGKRHSEASDVYAFGATLYELVVGEPPHGTDDIHLILKRIIREDVLLPMALAGTELGALLLRVLVREPEERPSMLEVLGELEKIRLVLVQQTGDVAALVEATRSMSRADESSTTALRSTPLASPTPATPASTPSREMPTVAVRPPGSAPLASGSPPSSPLPWGIAGAAVVVALAVTGYFTLRSAPADKSSDTQSTAAASGSEADDRAQGRMAMDPTEAPGSMRSTPMRLVRPRPRLVPARPGASASVGVGAGATAAAPEEIPAADLAHQRARCIGKSEAYAMFKWANKLRTVKAHWPRVKAIYAALLDCKHTSAGQRRWVAYRLARLHIRAGACGHAERRWKQYLAAARVVGKPPARRPPCRERK